MSRKRLPPNERREAILGAAVELARRDGYQKITRDAIAEHADVSMGLVTRYFSTMPQLRRDVMRYAVQNSIVEIVAQGMGTQDPHAMKADPVLKQRAIDHMMTQH